MHGQVNLKKRALTEARMNEKRHAPARSKAKRGRTARKNGSVSAAEGEQSMYLQRRAKRGQQLVGNLVGVFERLSFEVARTFVTLNIKIIQFEHAEFAEKMTFLTL